MLHNGKRQSVYQVSWRSPNFYLKQVICIRNNKTSSFLDRIQDYNSWLQGTWASFPAKDQPRSHFGDCGEYSRSPEAFHLGRVNRGEEGEDGGNYGGGELRRDGLTSHTSQHYQLTMEIIEYKEMGKISDMILVQRLSKLQCNCFYVSLFIRNVVGKKIWLLFTNFTLLLQ